MDHCSCGGTEKQDNLDGDESSDDADQEFEIVHDERDGTYQHIHRPTDRLDDAVQNATLLAGSKQFLGELGKALDDLGQHLVPETSHRFTETQNVVVEPLTGAGRALVEYEAQTLC